MLGQKQGSRYGGFITGAVRLYSLIQRNYLHGDSPTNLTITFSTATNTTAAAQRHCLEAKRRNWMQPPGTHSLHSSDFGERNRYLQGATPIDAQQKNMELLTFSCS